MFQVVVSKNENWFAVLPATFRPLTGPVLHTPRSYPAPPYYSDRSSSSSLRNQISRSIFRMPAADGSGPLTDNLHSPTKGSLKLDTGKIPSEGFRSYSAGNAIAQSTAMEHQITGTTLRRKEQHAADDEKEELELDSTVKEASEPEEHIETLSRKDLGNFILLVVLCKYFQNCTIRLYIANM